MQPIDHVLGGAIFLVAFVQAFADPEVLKGLPRLTFYKAGAVTGVLLGGIVLLAWQVEGRPLAQFGYASWSGSDPTLALGLALLWPSILWLWTRLALGPLRQPLSRYYGNYRHLMPETPGNLAAAWAAGSLAAAGEEIAFRGFLLWYLHAFAGLPGALILSSLVFGIAHGYQGKAGMAFAAIAGMLLAGAYVWTGSLLLALWMHASYNFASFTLGYLLLTDRRDLRSS